MNSSNTKLKPLDHKKSPNNQPRTNPIPQKPQEPLKKPTPSSSTSSTSTPYSKACQPQQNPAYRKVAYSRSSNRTQKIQLYNCDDFQMPALEQQAYFEQQLQTNSKVEQQADKTSKISKPVPRNQVVLPKLEGDLSIKQVRDIEREMDAEMSKIMEKEIDDQF